MSTYTYTTPTFPITITSVIDYSLVDFVRVAIKGRHGKVIREVSVEDIDTETGSFNVTLTQEETAKIGAGRITIQARIKYLDGTVQPTNKYGKMMDECIDKVVI